MNNVIDLALIGKEAGVPTREMPGPFGETMYDQTWSKEYLPQVFSLLKERIEPGPVPMTGHGKGWNLGRRCLPAASLFRLEGRQSARRRAVPDRGGGLSGL